MNEQWQELKETIIEMRDNNEFNHEDVTSMCQFLVNYMNTLEKQMQESKELQFAKWVATKIFSDMFEDDPVAFAEIACRKLAKLGIIRADGDEWVLVKPQESEDKENDSN